MSDGLRADPQEGTEPLLQARARALVEAHKRVQKAERHAFPNGQCSFDSEWRAATEALRGEYRRSAVMVAKAFLALAASSGAVLVGDRPSSEPENAAGDRDAEMSQPADSGSLGGQTEAGDDGNRRPCGGGA